MALRRSASSGGRRRSRQVMKTRVELHSCSELHQAVGVGLGVQNPSGKDVRPAATCPVSASERLLLVRLISGGCADLCHRQAVPGSACPRQRDALCVVQRSDQSGSDVGAVMMVPPIALNGCQHVQPISSIAILAPASEPGPLGRRKCGHVVEHAVVKDCRVGLRMHGHGWSGSMQAAEMTTTAFGNALSVA